MAKNIIARLRSCLPALRVAVPIAFLAASCFGGGALSVSGGIMRTDNGGLDWQQANAVEESVKNGDKTETKTTTDLEKLTVRHLVLAPWQKGQMLAATSGGVYESQDYGETWKLVLADFNSADVLLQSKSVWLVAGQDSDFVGRILKTEDSGLSWQAVLSLPDKRHAMVALAKSPRQERLAALSEKGLLLESWDQGSSWSTAKDFKEDGLGLLWPDDLMVLTSRSGLYVRKAQGEFSLVTSALNTTGGLLADSSQRVNAYFAVATLSSSPETLLVTTNAGPWLSRNSGQDWTRLVLPISQTSEVGSIYSAAFGPSQGHIVLGLGNLLYSTRNFGQTWEVKNVANKGYIRYILFGPAPENLGWLGFSSQ